jgi:hypothetical protein
MNVRLVAYVEYYLILGRIENSVERNRKLGDSEIGGKMSPSSFYVFNEKAPHLRTKRGNVFGFNFLYVLGRIDILQKFITHF